MLSYPYIESLFRAVLAQSTTIQGRFHVCPKWGAELNTNNLDEVVKITIGEEPKPVFPIAILMPPRSESDYQIAGSPDSHRFLMLFLTTTHYTGANQVKDPHPHTGKSMHRVLEDWHDMKRCAVNFLRALQNVLEENPEHQAHFHISDRKPQTIDPVTTITNARLSGVLVQFTGIIGDRCRMEDYPADYIEAIELPQTIDSHDEHQH